MEASVGIADDQVKIGVPVPLFSISDNRFQELDMGPDDERFIVVQTEEENE